MEVFKDISVDELISLVDTCNNIEELSVYGYLFTRLKPNRDGVPFDQLFDKKILQLEDSQDNIRLKLVSVIRLIVTNAKDTKVIYEVEELVKIGDELLLAFEKSAHISTFEKNLLKSRYYRAKAFLYQLRKENDDMLECMKLCEHYADECSKTSDSSTLQHHQTIDNYIGCYESMSRTYFLIQDEEN
ncbi:hypothetical protein KA013_01305 [Patescibacteria group bacterium]|nr:hypothetical protein [Patescibacteria group bacterium]